MKVKNISIWMRIFQFFLPFLIALLGICVLYLSINRESSVKLFLLMFAYFIPPLGKESIIPIGINGGELTIPIINKYLTVPVIDPLTIALTIAFVDIVVALFLVWNYDLAKKIPLLGKFIAKIESIGKNSSAKYGWIRPLRFIGIILFVMVPFQGSGGLVGSIIGRLIGMKPWTIFFAISTGAIIGCLLIAYFADAIRLVFIKNFFLGILITIILVIICVMIFVYRKSLANVKK